MAESFLVHFLLSSVCILSLCIDLNQAFRNESVNLSFTVQKNQTGHIITKWSALKGSTMIHKNLKIDISSEVTENGGMQFFHLKGLISVPPPKPADYELFPGVGYYKFHLDGAKNFDDASSICSKEGGHLAIINSKAESNVLGNIYARHPQAVDFAWIGFHDQDVEGNYVTIYVPPPKPTNYELFPGIGYYKFYPDGASSFHEASSICSKDGGHLAIINSEAEANVLVAIYSRYPKAKDWAWVGFHDMDVEGKYVTIFGETLANTGFVKWHRGQPDNGDGNEDCGSIHKTAGDLNDLWCDKRVPWPFFCEYDLSWL